MATLTKFSNLKKLSKKWIKKNEIPWLTFFFVFISDNHVF